MLRQSTPIPDTDPIAQLGEALERIGGLRTRQEFLVTCLETSRRRLWYVLDTMPGTDPHRAAIEGVIESIEFELSLLENAK